MGDVLGSIFGGARGTTATQTPDPQAQAFNRLKLEQLQALFAGTPYSSFAYPNDAYSPSPDVADLYKSANNTDLSNLMSLDDYIKMGFDKTRNYVSQIAIPEIMSQLALSGLESSGAVPEAIAKATAGIGLPFVQSLPAASAALTAAKPQAMLMNAQRASTLFPMADYSRLLRESDLLRRQGVVTTGLTGLPFTPGSTTQQRQSQQPLFGLFGQG